MKNRRFNLIITLLAITQRRAATIIAVPEIKRDSFNWTQRRIDVSRFHARVPRTCDLCPYGFTCGSRIRLFRIMEYRNGIQLSSFADGNPLNGAIDNYQTIETTGIIL